MTYSPDELEFAISQYIDGTLGPLEQAALEEVLAKDESARAMLAEYARLHEALRTKLSQPQVDFEQLSRDIAATLAHAEPPVKHYRFEFARYAKIISVAASILIAIGVIAKLVMNRGGVPPTVSVTRNVTSETAP